MTLTQSACGWTHANEASTADAGDFEAQFDRCARSLYRYILIRIGNDVHLADDFMQQLWVQAGRRGGEIASNEVEFYLRAVAANLIRQHWRRIGSRAKHVPICRPELARELAARLAQEQLPEDQLENREIKDQLLLAITELPSFEQELIIDHYFRGQSHTALASTRGLTERAVEGRLYRARQALRAALEHLEP